MASPRRITLRVDIPHIDRKPELSGDDIENTAVRPFVTCQHSPRKTEIAHQHGNAKAIVIPAMLPDKGQISFCQ